MMAQCKLVTVHCREAGFLRLMAYRNATCPDLHSAKLSTRWERPAPRAGCRPRCCLSRGARKERPRLAFSLRPRLFQSKPLTIAQYEIRASKSIGSKLLKSLGPDYEAGEAAVLVRTYQSSTQSSFKSPFMFLILPLFLPWGSPE